MCNTLLPEYTMLLILWKTYFYGPGLKKVTKEKSMTFHAENIRSSFPSLQSGAVFLDNPGGTQVPQHVIDAVVDYYKTSNANHHGLYETSRKTGIVVDNARQAMADFINAATANEIVFGQNMTSLTFHLSRSIAKLIQPSDEIMVTHLDHDANVAPWLFLQEQGAKVTWVKINTTDCTLDLNDFESKLTDKTRLIAVGYASNAVGSINEVKLITEKAHAKGALVFVDAVHAAPHVPLDVQDIDCDFLACSPYKFYGPHVGVLYGKQKHLETLEPYKVRPADNNPPDRFETGTQSFEALSGVIAGIDFLAALGVEDERNYSNVTGRKRALKNAMAGIQQYEKELFVHMIDGLKQIEGLTIYGITDQQHFSKRTPTIAFTMDRFSPQEIASYLGKHDVYVWDGNYYALALMEYLGLEEHGGAVRVGIGCYNTQQEIDRFLDLMKNL